MLVPLARLSAEVMIVIADGPHRFSFNHRRWPDDGSDNVRAVPVITGNSWLTLSPYFLYVYNIKDDGTPPTKVSSCYATIIHAQRKQPVLFLFLFFLLSFCMTLFFFLRLNKCHTHAQRYARMNSRGLLPTYSIDKMALVSPIIYGASRIQIINTRKKKNCQLRWITSEQKNEIIHTNID